MSPASDKLRQQNMLERQLYLVKRTQIEMLRDRGFDVYTSGEINLLDATQNEFINYYQNVADSIVPPKTIREVLSRGYTHSTTGETVYVYYIPDLKSDTVGKDHIEPFIEIVDNYSYNSYIMITNHKLTSKSEDTIKLKSKTVEKFMDNELIINPTLHNSVPFHEGISADEQRYILERNNWNVANLPKLPPHDPIARYYGFAPGKMIRIHRFNPLPGTMVNNILFYRIVPDLSLMATIQAGIDDANNDLDLGDGDDFDD